MSDQPEEFAVLRIPFSEEEFHRIEAAAEAEGISIEEWLRARLLDTVRQKPQPGE